MIQMDDIDYEEAVDEEKDHQDDEGDYMDEDDTLEADGEEEDNHIDNQGNREEEDNQGTGEVNMPKYDPDDPSSPWYILRHI